MSWWDFLDPRSARFQQRFRRGLRGVAQGSQPGLPRPLLPYSLNAELKLAGPPSEPLKDHDIEAADPLQSFAEIFAQVREGERASVSVDFRAVPPDRAAKIRAYWLSRAPGRVVRGELAEPETQSLPVGQVVSRRQDTFRLNNKLNPQAVLFEVQILIRVESWDDPNRPVELFRSFLTAFQQWKAANEITVHGQLLRVAGHDVRFFGADAFSWRRWWFLFRLNSGLFWPASPGLVTAWELSGLLKPWTKNNSSSAPLRVEDPWPPPRPSTSPRRRREPPPPEPEVWDGSLPLPTTPSASERYGESPGRGGRFGVRHSPPDQT